MIKTPDYIIGIDNGISGAICVLGDNGIVEKRVMPVINSTKSKKEYDTQAIIELFLSYPKVTVILEKAHAMPKLGTVQAFTFGKNYGIMIGIISALKLPYHVVHARRWQKVLFADVSNKDTKQSSVIVAQRLFPDEDFKTTPRCKKANHNLTDSALLAYYGRSLI